MITVYIPHEHTALRFLDLLPTCLTKIYFICKIEI